MRTQSVNPYPFANSILQLIKMDKNLKYCDHDLCGNKIYKGTVFCQLRMQTSDASSSENLANADALYSRHLSQK